MRLFLFVSILVLVIIIVIPLVTLYVRAVITEDNTPLVLDRPITVEVFVQGENKTVNMDLGHYLVGVIAAEMPAAFPEEALKGQAIAARTYVYKRLKSFGGSGCSSHPESDICTDSTCCQAYFNNAQLLSRWGVQYQQYWHKIAQAIQQTRGLILTHQGIPIDPLFHSTCGGKTENSENVWSATVPYLRSVGCSYCQESPKYTMQHSLSVAQVASALSGLRDGVIPVASISASLKNMSVASETDSGRVGSVKIGNVIYEATEVRRVLGLNSTRFRWILQGGTIVFTTQGYGHGVGLCQYGAAGMATKGYNYWQILRHYYQRVELEPIPNL